ncbi:MAG: hypothetical protein FJZ98_01570 [Chloroflexi bacterium]|nr:hypothetical protein [Chloroflexota bacterium]
MEINQKSFRILILFFAVVLLMISCQPAPPLQDARIETPALPEETKTDTSQSQDGDTQPEITSPQQPKPPQITEDSPFCEIIPNNLLIPICENGELAVTRSDDPRRVNLFFNRDVVFSADAIAIQAEITSTPPQGLQLDQNQYGIYMIDRDGIYHAVRVSGQYFNFETWSLEEGVKVESRYNRVFSPLLKPSGQNNHLELACANNLCEFNINGILAGRIPEGPTGIDHVGVFTAADWDQNFGSVIFKGFGFDEMDSNDSDKQTFKFSDELSEDQMTFSDRGLTGAFHSYKSDGFHFSPVVPFNFYSTATGPSLADISVEATITMEINPGVSGSQFGGIVCRASQEGAYMAVIKVDGTYTLFRDTPQRPLAVLASKASDAILPDREPNRLRLDCSGNQIDFFINGIQVASVTDTRYNLSFGRAGLYTKAGGDPKEDAIVFSNLIISELR